MDDFRKIYMIRSPLIQASGFEQLIHDYTSGSGNEQVPTGSSNLVEEIWGAAGSGRKNGSSGNSFGGGGGSYSYRSTPILSSDWGKNIPYACGVPGAAKTTIGNGGTGGGSSIGPITLNGVLHTITCFGGAQGTSTSGLGGTATGGTINTPGGNGTGGINGSGRGGDCANSGGLGGDNGQNGGSPGGGGGAGYIDDVNDFNSGAGGLPRVRFTWT